MTSPRAYIAEWAESEAGHAEKQDKSSSFDFIDSGHVKHLALLATGQAPDVYMKSYFRPQNLTKRKTQVVKASQNPTFSREVRRCLFLFSVVLVVEVVDMQLYSGLWVASMCCRHVLEESVWNSGGLVDNNKLYLLYVPLLKLKNRPEDRKGNRVLEGWFSFDKNLNAIYLIVAGAIFVTRDILGLLDIKFESKSLQATTSSLYLPLEFNLIFASEHYIISITQRPKDSLLKITRYGIHNDVEE
ncbi:unnamed protein product [Heligmosomoides polygyrus]|uniref:C2 domain-containing protein n=1 Tax=Heligmosomoides polygyrus TaxID=6339 RepID=A0A3P8AST4_HELPZ|nr:unnamed protein product [Heligmosomoides polygyrus]